MKTIYGRSENLAAIPELKNTLLHVAVRPKRSQIKQICFWCLHERHVCVLRSDTHLLPQVTGLPSCTAGVPRSKNVRLRRAHVIIHQQTSVSGQLKLHTHTHINQFMQCTTQLINASSIAINTIYICQLLNYCQLKWPRGYSVNPLRCFHGETVRCWAQPQLR